MVVYHLHEQHGGFRLWENGKQNSGLVISVRESNGKYSCPKLEYACAAWDPYLEKDIASLERIQKKAARFCSNNYHPTASVTEMVQDLGWMSLELRRTTTRLNLLYKMSRAHSN